MENVIEIYIDEKKDFIEKYNDNKMDSSLIDYLINQISIKDKRNIKLIIHNKNNFELDFIRLVNEGLEKEYKKMIEKRHKTNIKQILLILVGIFALLISMLISENSIFREIFVIIGWVPIWEVIYIGLFSDINDKIKIKNLNKLLKANIEVVNN